MPRKLFEKLSQFFPTIHNINTTSAPKPNASNDALSEDATIHSQDVKDYHSTASSSTPLHRPSHLYVLFTAFVNLNALSLLPPKVDGCLIRRRRQKEDINSNIFYKRNNIKCNKKALKRKLNRNNSSECGVLQLQKHCAFFFVLLLALLTMSFGDAGGIIEEIPGHSSNNKKENVNGGILEVKVEEVKNDNNGEGGFVSHHRSSSLGRMTLFFEQTFTLKKSYNLNYYNINLLLSHYFSTHINNITSPSKMLFCLKNIDILQNI